AAARLPRRRGGGLGRAGGGRAAGGASLPRADGADRGALRAGRRQRHRGAAGRAAGGGGERAGLRRGEPRRRRFHPRHAGGGDGGAGRPHGRRGGHRAGDQPRAVPGPAALRRGARPGGGRRRGAGAGSGGV
ncbi:MAG: Tricarboxylate transport protein TctC, partial [uncultured Craurococcus sp.]